MFNQHSLDTMESVGVSECWRQGTVNGISRADDLWQVTTSDGQSVQGERVVLAMGVNQKPRYPDWASKFESTELLSHVFEMGESLPHEGEVVVVGGG
ncbi:NAD(P)-binding domain-containing protein [Halobacillus salinarum]|uniref:NAD(P)-binding domain-containing protein n=1 Tax=Halobacillus salinarum TaxID=2932257 RepID=A0ABY4EKX8_9BACI|nr:NAD(P)-binding domain-containing protein [Halobacillus salinarum]UOQ44294.1 NAD(P)-binding domain-containing protein [Halobacillus salinarum]